MSHNCAIPQCETMVGDELLMCSKHWRMVAPTTQKMVYKFWRIVGSYILGKSKERPGNYAECLKHYNAARARAIGEVCQTLQVEEAKAWR